MKTVAERQSSESPKAKKHKSTDSEESENSDEYSAQNQDSGRTVFDPDRYVLTNEEHGTMTPATHKICRNGWIVLLFNSWKWRATRCMQFDHHDECATIIVSQ